MTAAAEREYVKLLSERKPQVIASRRAYAEAMREIEELTVRSDRRSEAQTAYYRLLTTLVAEYERSAGAGRWPKVAPLEALRELMELKAVTQTRIAQVLGDRAAASSILSGRRQISKAQAKKLGFLFNVDAGVFI